jgi:hypothetical protein
MSIAEDFILLRDQLKVYIPLMQKAAEVVRDEDVSNYPILVVHKQELEIGIPMDMTIPLPGQWKINVSTLEEFVARKLIEDEKVDEFRKLYKHHENHVCLFVISSLGAQFIFYEKQISEM